MITLARGDQHNHLYAGLLAETVLSAVCDSERLHSRIEFPLSGLHDGQPRHSLHQDRLSRTGTGNIDVAASGNVDLTNGQAVSRQVYSGGQLINPPAQVGGTSIYTAGHPVALTTEVLIDPITGAPITVDLSALVSATSNLSNMASYAYGNGTARLSAPGVLVADCCRSRGRR